MGRNKFTSPTLQLKITDEQREEAIKSSSGGCLIADAIKKQYPQYTRVQVDMATIRITDVKRGQRYVYLTPAAAQSVLLYFDQGWPNPVEEILVRTAVKVLPVIRTPGAVAQREARKAELEAKIEGGEELTPREKASLTRLRTSPERPTRRGKAEVKLNPRANEHGGAVVAGGTPPKLKTHQPHPNLLRGRDRHFGAKVADPGQAFKEAVEVAVAERLSTTTVELKPDVEV